MKNKTLATWLALVGGPLGLHRFYLRGAGDALGWMLPLPSLLGCYGLMRMRALGVDDPWIWWLLPLLGLIVAGCALTAIVYGLQTTVRWNLRFNPTLPSDAAAGQTNWLTIVGVAAALMVGTVALMTALAISVQGVFEASLSAGPSAGLQDGALAPQATAAVTLRRAAG